MDAVRFGRALGFGARQAVKTMLTAGYAAAAANPSGKRGSAAAGKVVPSANRPAAQAAAREAAKTAARTIARVRDVERGGRRFGAAVWKPFVRLSGVLWLEVSGVFFGIFALFALQGVWKWRGNWPMSRGSAGEHERLLGAVAMLAIFGYFCVSSFVRARRRERRR